VKAPTPSARPAKSTGEKRAEAHDLHAPGEHGKRR
jgi:hypothetical protein